MNIANLNTISLDGKSLIIKKGGGGGNSGGGGDTPSMPDMPIIGDGKTYLYLHITSMACSSVTLYLSQTVANGVTIDWGDGSAPETVSGTGKITPTHNYLQVGKYTISLAPNTDCELGLGHSSSTSTIMGYYETKNELLRNTLRAVEIGDNIAYVTGYAFQRCYLLSDVIIGKNISSIGASAFCECWSLSNVVILHDSIFLNQDAFNDCYNLKNVIVPNGIVLKNSSNVFLNCKSLPAITISNSSTGIGAYSFRNCTSLKSITIPDSVTEIGSTAFMSTSGIAKLNINNLSSWCATSLTDIDANPLSGIGGDLYVNNALVTNLVIPDNVSKIKPYVFYKCTSLSSVTIPDSVTEIGNRAFSRCTNLSSIIIPNSVTSIGMEVFAYCYSLQSVTIPDSVTTMGSHTFSSCYNLTSVTIGDSVTSIGKYTFSDCSSLTSVTIPDSVTEIGSYAFRNCSSLTSVTIGNGVTSIGNNAFYECSSLTSVTIGNGVTSIGNNAFYNCKKVQTYDFSQCTSVPALSNTNAFDSISNTCKIKVPAALLDEWKAATNWSSYASRIVAA